MYLVTDEMMPTDDTAANAGADPAAGNAGAAGHTGNAGSAGDPPAPVVISELDAPIWAVIHNGRMLRSGVTYDHARQVGAGEITTIGAVDRMNK